MYSPNRTLPYSRQLIEEDDIRAVIEVLKSDFLTQGPKIPEFEKALADYCGAKYAVAVATGTAALHAACFAAGLSSGEELVTSPITFAATSNAALYCGARPVFVDIEPETGNIDPSLIEAAITEKTRILAPVDYSGHPVDLDPILEIARKRSLVVIEDASHALGATYKGKKIGSLSDMTVLSFHPVKPITTGEGGAVLTNNEEYYKKLQLFRTHGITKDPDLLEEKDVGPWYYEMHQLGYNFRITDIQCALGLSQLAKLERFIRERRAVVDFYREALAGIPEIEMTREKDYAFSPWHLFPIRLKGELAPRRREIFIRLREAGIWVQVHYIPVYLQPYYRKLGYPAGLCPKAEVFSQSEITLPVFQGMKREETSYVIDRLIDIVETK